MPDRDALERELRDHLREAAPRPPVDAAVRLADRITGTRQRSRSRLAFASPLNSDGWGPIAAMAAVAAAALVLGIAIGQLELPVASSRSPKASADASSLPPAASATQAVGWEEPGSYTYVVLSSCGERSLIGRFRIQVRDGTPVAYQRVGSGTHLPFPLEAMPSLADLVEEVELARADGADVADVRVDPTDGHPVEIQIDHSTSTVDDEACYFITEYLPGVHWVEPTAYSFAFEASCGRRVLHGRFRADVTNGVAQTFEQLDPVVLPIPLEPADIPSLGEMLRRAAEATASGESEVTVERDPIDGHPTLIDIDWIVNAIDDEECYTITEYSPGP